MEAHCPECGSPIPPPESDDPDTTLKCTSCGGDLGTVGDALKAAEKTLNDAEEEIAKQFGKLLREDE